MDDLIAGDVDVVGGSEVGFLAETLACLLASGALAYLRLMIQAQSRPNHNTPWMRLTSYALLMSEVESIDLQTETERKLGVNFGRDRVMIGGSWQ